MRFTRRPKRFLGVMDICGGVYFCWLFFFQVAFFIFGLSGETEAGSAGEQPARDSLMADEKVNQRSGN